MALKVKDLAERLDICEHTIYNMIRRGTFPVPHFKIGSAIRFDESVVDAYTGKLVETVEENKPVDYGAGMALLQTAKARG